MNIIDIILPPSNYLIKKIKYFKNPTPIPIGVFFPIIYIIMSVILLLAFYLDSAGDIYQENFIIPAIFVLIAIIWGIYLLTLMLKIKRIRNSKSNGLGILKKAKVTAVKKTKFARGKGRTIEVYYFEAEEGGMIYYSDGSSKGSLLGTSLNDLQLLYAKYGFTFDENNDQKENLLRKIDECIAEKEYEIENSGLILRGRKGRKLGELKVDRKMVDDGYIAPYWEINSNRVTVGDTVDIYVDPDNPKMYWVDTDFLFEANYIQTNNPIHN